VDRSKERTSDIFYLRFLPSLIPVVFSFISHSAKHCQDDVSVIL
jgi:hypothetical protein